jgi:hypothetical protein
MRTNKYNVVEGEKYESNYCGWFEVIKYNSSTDVDIRFCYSGYKRKTTVNYIKKGVVYDPYYPKVKGVGFIGEGIHKPKINGKMSKCHSVWFQMLRRCYDSEYKSYEGYGSKGVTVCEDWHNYQNFAEWYYANHKEGLAIDKDILRRGNKIYGPEFCRFVPVRINSLLTPRSKCRGDLPIGVHRRKNSSGEVVSYVASISGGTTTSVIFLGHHKTPELAFEAYKETKLKHIKEVASEEFLAGNITEDIYHALLNWEVVPYPEKL